MVGCACDTLDHCTCGAAYLARQGREPGAPPQLLHVTNGESAGNTLRRTALGGAVLAWQDALHAGPVPDVGRAELRLVRAGFLSECGWGGRRALLASLERRDRQFVDALGGEVVLWFEHDLYDQLQLVEALALAAEHDAAPELIVVGSFPGRPGYRGLGELAADELESLWPLREPAAVDAVGAAAEVWAALRAREPTALAKRARDDVPGLPYVAPALRRLLEELPAPGDGLSTTERHVLRTVADGAVTPVAAFVAAQGLEEAPFLGDAWFYRALAELGHGEPRLLETQDAAPLPRAPPLSDGQTFAWLRLRLTRNGERVLAGELDRVELAGIDRWVGGTHVSGGDVWRWDPAARLLER
jgi:hypothetical protein